VIVDQESAENAAGLSARMASSALVRQPVASMREENRSGADDLPAEVRTVLTRTAVGEEVEPEAFARTFQASAELEPPTRDVVLGSLLMLVMSRGPVVDEVEALLRGALTMDDRQPAESINGSGRPVLVLAGSGKKGLRILNVSTPAALVAAAAGARVIKVGSAATSSALGSRDLVRALGLREHRTPAEVRAELANSGFAFVPIEPEIPVLDRLYGGRFHMPNPFSFGLAALASPVRGDITVFGLSHPRVDVAARVLSRFGLAHVDVLTTRLPSGDYLDEIGPAGELRWCRVRDGEVGPIEVELGGTLNTTIRPCDLPAPRGPREAIERVAELLAGGGSHSHRAVVTLNAAHLLVLSGLAASLPQGHDLAEDILRSGAALPGIPAACSPGGRA
jgi:anthranilate phosphoribosyltransferase